MTDGMDFGRLAADVLVGHLRRVASPTGSRYVIEGLQRAEYEALFDGLLALCDETVQIAFGPQDVTMGAIPIADGPPRQLLVPFLVDADACASSRNRGNEGVASKLRDLIGHDPDGRIRSLVTLTPGGNETQQSARDPVVDGNVLSLGVLADELMSNHGIDADDGEGDPRTGAIERYCEGWGRRHDWTHALGQIESFCTATRDVPVEEMGRSLGLLDGFLPDSDAAWSDDPRLEHNAASFAKAHAALADLTRDPVNALRTDFSIESIERLTRGGLDSLSSVDLAELSEALTSKGITAIDLDTIELDGTLLYKHRLTDGSRNSGSGVLAVATAGAFTVRLCLSRAPKDGERVRLLGWDAERKREVSLAKATRTESQGRAVYTLPVDAPTEPFSVRTIVVTNGKRSFARRSAQLQVAIYQPIDVTRPLIAFESDTTLDQRHQTWVPVDDKAHFEVFGDQHGSLAVSVERSDFGGEQPAEPDDDLDGDEAIQSVDLDVRGLRLPVRIQWKAPTSVSPSDERLDLLEYEAFRSVTSRKACVETIIGLDGDRLRSRLRSAVRQDDDWRVSLGDARLSIRAWNDHAEEHAVGFLLDQSDVAALTATQDSDGQLGPLEEALKFDDDLEELRSTRRRLFGALRKAADDIQRLSEASTAATGLHPTSLLLLDLEPLAADIEAYFEAWLAATEDSIVPQAPFDSIHDVLLSLDSLMVFAASEGSRSVRRLTILPTHPWLLMAQLQFQRQVENELNRPGSRASVGKSEIELRRGEVRDLAQPGPFEDWSTPHEEHLRRVAGAPFHWTFVPDSVYRRQGDLGHLTRVVRTKIARYLRMHHHLEHERRTLRIGFVNPGDGRHLLDGLRAWLRTLSSEQREDGRGVPKIEVLLFGPPDEAIGGALDSFFQGRLATSQDNTVDNLLLEKLRYLKCTPKRGIPEGDAHRTHLCFAMGLVKRRTQRAIRSMNTYGCPSAMADPALCGSTPFRLLPLAAGVDLDRANKHAPQRLPGVCASPGLRPAA